MEKLSINKNDKDGKRYFILVGSQENWQTSLEHNLWGFTQNIIGHWNKTNSGDLLAFYVTSPLKKVIGFGKVGKKFINENLIWNDEKLFGRSLWKYKFEIEPFFVCANWQKGIRLPPLTLGVSRKLVDKQMFYNLVKEADKTWKSVLVKEFFGK